MVNDQQEVIDRIGNKLLYRCLIVIKPGMCWLQACVRLVS